MRFPILAHADLDDNGKSLFWIVVEYNVALLVGSLPTLRKLTIFRRAFGSNPSSDKSGVFCGTPFSSGQYPLQKTSRASRSFGKSGIGLGTLSLEETESRERIFEAPGSSR